jgi:hypothetical protein
MKQGGGGEMRAGKLWVCGAGVLETNGDWLGEARLANKTPWSKSGDQAQTRIGARTEPLIVLLWTEKIIICTLMAGQFPEVEKLTDLMAGDRYLLEYLRFLYPTQEDSVRQGPASDRSH